MKTKNHVGKVFFILMAYYFFIQTLPVSAASNTSDTSRPEHLGMKLYRGELHAHTSISDGVKMPLDAFQFVRANTKLDFFSTTEHDVTFDISSGNDYLKSYTDSYSQEYKILNEQANQFNSSSFVTFPGVEITFYDNAGHMNLFNTEWFPRTYGKGATGDFGMGDLKYDLPTVYARIAEDPNAIAQFNHPDSANKGDFFGFKHYNKDIDKNVTLFEYKYPRYFDSFIKALDKGWHLSPTYGGDEHQADWGISSPSLAGVWTNELSRAGIYDAMKNRRTYSTFDENFELTYSANGNMMGSILPETTKELTLHIDLKDPDIADQMNKVIIYKNNGEIVKEYTDINSNVFTKDETVTTSNGEYYLVRVIQKDGDEITSAPIWIGDVTRGTDNAPDIKVKDGLPTMVTLGQVVYIPEATASDDSGATPNVTVDVYNSKGAVAVTNNQFKIEELGEYFVRYYATDANGNSRVQLKRIVVDENNLDANKLLNEFQPIVNVGAKEDQVGITLVTDKVLKNAYVQYKPASDAKWDAAGGSNTKVSYFESAYGENIDTSNYRILASHEADLSGLQKGTVYQYRYGISPNGPWGPEYSFETAPESKDTTIYLMGDVNVPGRDPNDFKLFTDMLNVLKEKNPNGKLMVQIGDLVNAGGSTELWTDAFTYIYKNLNLLSANLVGNHEMIQDSDASSFTNFFNLPENGEGTYKETNYSYDYGKAHIAVINSPDLNDEQLKWLEQDMRATDKKWKIVMGHFPYYGASHSDDPGMSTNRAKITKRLQQLGISLYVGGHDHVYKRTTIRDGVMNNSQEAMNLGTTYITLGTTGPKFYGNAKHDWDNIVFDDNVQTGVILDATDEALSIKAYDKSGNIIDDFTLNQPTNYMAVTSTDTSDGSFKGVGVLNYPGSLDHITVVGEKYDKTGTQLLETQVKEVNLEHLGREQVIPFDQAISFNDQNTIKLHVWDNTTNKKEVFPSITVREAMNGEGTAEKPYLISNAQDLEKIKFYPDKHFVLTTDIVGNQDIVTAIGSGDTPFSGVFDGQGHFIKDVKISSDNGAGLFRVNNGTIKNLAVLNADLNVTNNDVGILVDTNNGTVENSYTTGSISGNANVGGLVGVSNGIIRNSYSTANVKAAARQAGGLVGITNRGSILENSYTTGSVSAGISNAGGLSGYGYNDTFIQNSIALNPSVITTSSANRIVGRVLLGETATLENNFANENMVVSKEGITLDAVNNEKGLGKNAELLKSQAIFDEGLGWDFEKIWKWDTNIQRPVLISNQENTRNSSSDQKPSLAQDANGSYLITSIADLQVMDRFPNENYLLKNDLDFAGQNFTPLAVSIPFTGTFDGNGKTIKNLTSQNGGLFNLNGGTIKNIAIVNADVAGDKTAPQTGILVNLNNGTIEKSYTTGKVIGTNNVGGIVGYSNAVLRNSYSTADVTAQVSQAGGLVGITNGGSLTESSYATGNVSALKSNAGGITGYGYNGTVVKNTIALNTTVTSPSMANRVVARVLSGNTATLVNNFSFTDMIVNKESSTSNSTTSVRGLGKTKEEVENQLTYSQALGWNFETVWVWDETTKRPVLKSTQDVVEPEVPVNAPALKKDGNGFYQITSIADLNELNKYPAEQYILINDLDFKDVTDASPLNKETAFTGILDGNGKTIKNYHSSTGGLMAVNNGTIKNLGSMNADIASNDSKIGILANINGGTIENSYTTGKVKGGSTVGGLVGESTGTIKNSYSTAEVKANASQAGGLVGITNIGSKTENSYATGSVAAGSSNAGGLSGYAYNTTVIQNSIALNTSILTTSASNRIVGRVKAGDTATLVNNFAYDNMPISKEGMTLDNPNNEKGLGKSSELLKSQATFKDGLGWNFETIWTWDNQAGRPLLVSNKEQINKESGSPKPSLSQDANGYYLITSIEDLKVINSFPTENYRLQNDLNFAGQSFSSLAVLTPFTGVFDGNGKKIENVTSQTGALFHVNRGTIKNVVMINANVTGDSSTPTGIIANFNDGTVETSYATGKVVGINAVGGLVGYSNKIIRNSYSTADVTAQGNQAGGLVGITNSGSVTENSYATGAVNAAKANAGGITGYAYEGTIIQNNLVLNPTITSPSSANRIVGRIYTGENPILKNNLANKNIVVSKESVTTEALDNSKGLGVSPEEIASKLLFEKTLGWDFQSVWAWDENEKRPTFMKATPAPAEPKLEEMVISKTYNLKNFKTKKIVVATPFSLVNLADTSVIEQGIFVKASAKLQGSGLKNTKVTIQPIHTDAIVDLSGVEVKEVVIDSPIKEFRGAENVQKWAISNGVDISKITVYKSTGEKITIK